MTASGKRHELQPEDLLGELKSDHEEVRRLVWVLRMLVLRGDFDLAFERATELQAFLGSHFLKEEWRLRDVLACLSDSSTPPSPTFPIVESMGRQKRVMDSLISRHERMRESFREIQVMSTAPDREKKLKAFSDFERVLLGLLREEENTDLVFFVPPSYSLSTTLQKMDGDQEGEKEGEGEREGEGGKRANTVTAPVS